MRLRFSLALPFLLAPIFVASTSRILPQFDKLTTHPSSPSTNVEGTSELCADLIIPAPRDLFAQGFVNQDAVDWGSVSAWITGYNETEPPGVAPEPRQVEGHLKNHTIVSLDGSTGHIQDGSYSGSGGGVNGEDIRMDTRTASWIEIDRLRMAPNSDGATTVFWARCVADGELSDSLINTVDVNHGSAEPNSLDSGGPGSALASRSAQICERFSYMKVAQVLQKNLVDCGNRRHGQVRALVVKLVGGKGNWAAVTTYAKY